MKAADAGPGGNTSGAARRPAAGLARRWFSLIYDGLLLSAVLLIAGFAALPIVGPPHFGDAYSSRQLYLLPTASSAFLFLYYFVVAGIYCIAFWSNGRRTLAMKTWGLGLSTVAAGPPDARRATLRYLCAWIGPAVGLAGYQLFGRWGLVAGLANYFWGWLDADSQFLHDRLAGTRIIRS